MKNWFRDIIRSDNKYLIISIGFFLFWKFFLIAILWSGRHIAPEPDDSYTYIAHIASVANCSNLLFCTHPLVSIFDFSGFTYLSYRLILGVIAKAFLLTPENVYFLSFYLGTILLPFCLVFFLKGFTSNIKLISLTIFFLAFLHGNGESHGFFWVVPSFLSLLIFFVLSGYVLKKSIPYIYLIPLIFIFTFSHPIAVYLVLIFPIYFILFSFFSKTFDTEKLKRIVLVIFSVIFLTLCQSYFLQKVHGSEYYSLHVTLNKTSGIFENIFNNTLSTRLPEQYSITNNPQNFIQQKIATIHAVYFKWFFPHWLCVIPFILIFALLIYKKEVSLIAFYLATLIFYIVATFFNEFGFRSAIVLWPTTFILLSFASWHFYLETRSLKQKPFFWIIRVLFLLSVGVFFFLNMLYSTTINANLNAKSNYKLNQDYLLYIEKNISLDKTINLHPILSRTTGGKKLLETYTYLPIDKHPDYIITIHIPEIKESSFISFNSKVSSFIGLGPIHPPYVTQIAVPNNYTLATQSGMIWIYKK